MQTELTGAYLRGPRVRDTRPLTESGPTAAGVPASFAAFYRDTADQTLRVARLLVGDRDATDLLQDAYTGLYRHWDEVAAPEAYLRRALTNAAANVYRRRDRDRRRDALLSRELPETQEGGEEFLADLIEALPFKQRAVLVLRFYLDLTEPEIAAALGMRRGSVGPTQTRALRAIRKELHDVD